MELQKLLQKYRIKRNQIDRIAHSTSMYRQWGKERQNEWVKDRIVSAENRIHNMVTYELKEHLANHSFNYDWEENIASHILTWRQGWGIPALPNFDKIELRVWFECLTPYQQNLVIATYVADLIVQIRPGSSYVWVTGFPETMGDITGADWTGEPVYRTLPDFVAGDHDGIEAVKWAMHNKGLTEKWAKEIGAVSKATSPIPSLLAPQGIIKEMSDRSIVLSALVTVQNEDNKTFQFQDH